MRVGADAERTYTDDVGAGFHIENFGCRAARADGEAIASQLRAAGCVECPTVDAEVVVVNTCSVTAEADREARAYIRRVRRANPAAKIVATGCYAQRAPEELAGLDGVSAVVGNSHKALAPEIVLGLTRERAAETRSTLIPLAALTAPMVLADDSFAHSFLEEAQVAPGVQTRPNLKIQEGCGNRCSFCVIPQTRGSSRSLPGDAVMKQVEGFVAAGGLELVLSGINLGRWGRDFDPTLAAEERRNNGAPTTLASLVRRIFEQTQLTRLRLSSIEPMDWDAELIELMAEFGDAGSPATGPRRWGRLARHAHLPLQSGSDAVLRRMHRRYRPWHYAEKAAALVRAAGPELTLGADVMVGFPGETDAEFEETLELVRALPFGYLHLFPFSPRPGTRAWALHAERPVTPQAVAERMQALRDLGAEKMRTHRTQMIGRELEAITLHTPAALAAEGRTAALTENFIAVELHERVEANRLVRVRANGLTPEGALDASVFTAHSPACAAAVAV
ncbi:MAG: MiaB/RimO family radical SAM methylthiotransferase [Terracidiphilus sp.]|nr:MiaB/RimO family radical SAM methylthiotransferase [Terracidiphilus sp.]